MELSSVNCDWQSDNSTRTHNERIKRTNRMNRCNWYSCFFLDSFFLLSLFCIEGKWESQSIHKFEWEFCVICFHFHAEDDSNIWVVKITQFDFFASIDVLNGGWGVRVRLCSRWGRVFTVYSHRPPWMSYVFALNICMLEYCACFGECNGCFLLGMSLKPRLVLACYGDALLALGKMHDKAHID